MIKFMSDDPGFLGEVRAKKYKPYLWDKNSKIPYNARGPWAAVSKIYRVNRLLEFFVFLRS